jgi:hypothetical protein
VPIRLSIPKLAASPVMPLKSKFKSELLHYGVDWQQDVNYLRDMYMEIYAIWESTQPFTYELDAEGNKQVRENKYDPAQDEEVYRKTEPLLREMILGFEGISKAMSNRTDVYRTAENAQHDFSTATSYAQAGDFAMATVYQSYALMKAHSLLDGLTREMNATPRRASRKLGYGYDVSGEQGEGGGTSGDGRHLWDTGNSPKRDRTKKNPANMGIDAEAESDYPELAEFKHKHVYWPPRTR